VLNERAIADSRFNSGGLETRFGLKPRAGISERWQ